MRTARSNIPPRQSGRPPMPYAPRQRRAEDLYREALEITREGVGEGHPNYAIHLTFLAGVLAIQGKPEEARPLYEQALEIFRATLPPNHPHIGMVDEHLGHLS